MGALKANVYNMGEGCGDGFLWYAILQVSVLFSFMGYKQKSGYIINQKQCTFDAHFDVIIMWDHMRFFRG